MKTSLNIDPELFKAAKKEAARSGRTLSDVISNWAKLGKLEFERKLGKKQITFQGADLGGSSKVDLTSRKDWMDKLDDSH